MAEGDEPGRYTVTIVFEDERGHPPRIDVAQLLVMRFRDEADHAADILGLRVASFSVSAPGALTHDDPVSPASDTASVEASGEG